MKSFLVTLICCGAVGSLLMAPRQFVAASHSAWVQSMSSNKVRASVLVNAGEPDPGWDITEEADINRLKTFLKNLPSARKPAWPNLGFRGFMLDNIGIPNLPREVRVFEGVIQVTENDIVKYYRDRRGLERWLRKEARDRGIASGLLE